MSDAWDYAEEDKAMLKELQRIERTADILADIKVERDRQMRKWGEQNHPLGFGEKGSRESANFARALCDARAKNGTVTWADILSEEYHEARAEGGLEEAREELIQVAAVAVAMVDWIDRGAPDASN